MDRHNEQSLAIEPGLQSRCVACGDAPGDGYLLNRCAQCFTKIATSPFGYKQLLEYTKLPRNWWGEPIQATGAAAALEWAKSVPESLRAAELLHQTWKMEDQDTVDYFPAAYYQKTAARREEARLKYGALVTLDGGIALGKVKLAERFGSVPRWFGQVPDALLRIPAEETA